MSLTFTAAGLRPEDLEEVPTGGGQGDCAGPESVESVKNLHEPGGSPGNPPEVSEWKLKQLRQQDYRERRAQEEREREDWLKWERSRDQAWRIQREAKRRRLEAQERRARTPWTVGGKVSWASGSGVEVKPDWHPDFPELIIRLGYPEYSWVGNPYFDIPAVGNWRKDGAHGRNRYGEQIE